MRNRLRHALFGAPQTPTKVGRYVVLEQLGAGGLGVVYAAYDPELDRKIALKLIHPSRVTREAAQRLQREAQALARLQHPGVAMVFDAGAYGEGAFIAMELVDGVTLDVWARTGGLRWRAIRDVLVAAGEGLAAAHRQGLVHRDFKPKNVIVDADGRPRVLDFGLACASGPTDRGDAIATTSQSIGLLHEALTQTGATLGTPRYMAAEQFAGRADARTDQWAFCATAWECFYGIPPFPADDVVTLRQRVAEGVPAPVPPGNPTPAWIERVLRRGLEATPSQRFATMEDLLTALRRDKQSRKRWALALVAVASLSAVGTAVAMEALRPGPTQASRAEVENLEREARAAAADGHFIYPSAERPEAGTALLRVLALEQLQGPSARDAHARATELRRELAELLVGIGDAYADRVGGTAFAADYYAAALLFDPEHPRATVRSALTPGELTSLRRKAEATAFSPAELQAGRVLAALAEPSAPAREAKVAALFRGKDRPAISTSVHLDALLGAQTEQAVREGSTQAPAPAAAPVEPSLGTAAAPRAEDRTSASSLRKGNTSPVRADSEIERGLAAMRRGDDEAAEQAFHRALNADPRSVAALLALSDLYFERGAYQKALGYARKATTLAPTDAKAHVQRGDTSFKVHRYDEAREAYKTAAALGDPGGTRGLERLTTRLGAP